MQQEITDAGLLAGHTVTVTPYYTSSSANVGTYTWDLADANVTIKSGDEDVTANYDITYGKTSAKITPRNIYIKPTVSSKTKVYDAYYFYAGGLVEITDNLETWEP